MLFFIAAAMVLSYPQCTRIPNRTASSHPIGSDRISLCGWICVSLRTSDERALNSRGQHHGVGWGAMTRHTMRTLSSLHHCK